MTCGYLIPCDHPASPGNPREQVKVVKVYFRRLEGGVKHRRAMRAEPMMAPRTGLVIPSFSFTPPSGRGLVIPVFTPPSGRGLVIPVFFIITPPSGRGLVIPVFFPFFLGGVVTCPRPPVFARPKKYSSCLSLHSQGLLS